MVQLTHALSEAFRMERRAQLIESVAPTLEQSAWGTVLLNTSQGYWLGPIVRPSRTGVLAVLRGTVRHWDELAALGQRFCDGVLPSSSRRPEICQSAQLRRRKAKLEGDPIARPPGNADAVGLRHPRPVIAEVKLLARIEHDDEFWASILHEQGGPPLEPQNADEITALCTNGSWRKQYWDFLRKSSGNDAVEAALQAIVDRKDWSKLIGVFVHALDDMPRAAQLFAEHGASCEDLNWARERIARYPRAPTRSRRRTC